MRCAWVEERLPLYLARELGAKEAEQVRLHLEQCAACATEAAEMTALQESMERALPTQIEAPARLEARVMEAVRALPAPRTSWRQKLSLPEWRPRLLLASGALCLLLAAGWFLAARTVAPLDMVRIQQAHQQALAEQQHPEIPLATPAELAESLTDRVQFPVAVADLQTDGAQLIGGSRMVVQGVPMARLHYEYQGHCVSLFEMDASRLAPPLPNAPSFPTDSYFVAKRDGLAYVAWRSGRTNYVMVARSVPMHLLFHLACHACEQQERL